MKQLDLKPFKTSFNRYNYDSLALACHVFRIPFSLGYINASYDTKIQCNDVIFIPCYFNIFKESISNAINRN